MNLYFRLLLIFVRSWFTRAKHHTATAAVHFRVYPFDCDVNLHLTNARYLAFADLGRVHLMGQLGLLRKILKRRMFPVANAAEVSFVRPIKPFQKLMVKTRLLAWDDKYWYTEHEFEIRGRLHAVSRMRGLFVNGRSVVPIEEVAALMGEPSAPPLPESILQWKQLLAVRKAESSASAKAS